eukprot:m51a1_g5224 hypothetical protein (259) ;mRNA; f:274316-275297
MALYMRAVAWLHGCEVRQAVIVAPRAVQLFARFASRTLLFAMGFYRVRVSGRVPSAARCRGLVVGNHVSLIDIISLWAVLPRLPSFVSKRSVLDWPVVGSLLQASRGLTVDRSKRDGSAREQVAERARAGSDELPLAMFPEGTTTNGTCLMPFKSGAFVAGEPVQLVTFRYPAKHFSPAYDVLPSGRYMVRLLSQVYNSVEITFLPEYVPSEQEKQDPKLFADGVRSTLARSLKLPTVEHTWEMKQKYMEEVYHVKYN